MKRILLLLTLVILFTACNDKTRFSVNGVIKNSKEKYIFLNRVEINTPIFLDSAKISKNGSFRFKVKAKEADFYQIGFSTSDFITLLANPGEKINLAFNGKNLYDNYVVKGSPETEKLQKLDKDLAETKSRLDSLSNAYTKASQAPGFDIIGPALQTEYTNVIKAQRKKNIEFIVNNVTSLASIKALYQRINPDTYVLYDPHDLQYLKIVTDSLRLRYPQSKQVQALTHDFEKEMNQLYVSKIQEIAKDIPKTSLNPDLLNTKGERISLSSLKGKYVLLAFWSVDSKECLAENLQLKQFYKLYSKKGFEIYQINLDENEARWKAAVKFDELPWISTREDDPGNPRNAILFNVKTLPANYFIDKESNIVASNLHGKALQIKLDQIFNK